MDNHAMRSREDIQRRANESNRKSEVSHGVALPFCDVFRFNDRSIAWRCMNENDRNLI